MKPKLIVLTGPTASGKTSLAVTLAERLGGEVISGDSMQIYRGMDIGTAKPTQDEMHGIPHHLIDIADISDRFSVAEFITLAKQKIDEVSSRSKLPIVAGGTGMYIDLLLSGRFFDDKGDPELRERLFRRAEEEGSEALHAYLASIDPASAAEIHHANVRRVVRAIEIALTTGKTKSQLAAEAEKAEKPYNCLHLHLTGSDRGMLYARVDARVDEMMRMGLYEEVRSLCEKGLREAPTASAAIGYKEFFPCFDGVYDVNTAVSLVKQHTRNYVKRQMTYFARIGGKAEIDICRLGAEEIIMTALKAAEEFYEKA